MPVADSNEFWTTVRNSPLYFSRLKLKWIPLIVLCAIFYFSLYKLLQFCLSGAITGPKSSDSVLLSRGSGFRGEIDWHDYAYLLEEAKRTGLGEHGVPLEAFDSQGVEVARQWAKYGYSGYVSDRIALNRSVVDLRPSG